MIDISNIKDCEPKFNQYKNRVAKNLAAKNRVFTGLPK